MLVLVMNVHAIVCAHCGGQRGITRSVEFTGSQETCRLSSGYVRVHFAVVAGSEIFLGVDLQFIFLESTCFRFC